MENLDEGLQSIMARFDSLESKFDKIEGKFDSLDTKMDKGFNGIHNKIDWLVAEIKKESRLRRAKYGKSLDQIMIDKNEPEL